MNSFLSAKDRIRRKGLMLRQERFRVDLGKSFRIKPWHRKLGKATCFLSQVTFRKKTDSYLLWIVHLRKGRDVGDGFWKSLEVEQSLFSDSPFNVFFLWAALLCNGSKCSLSWLAASPSPVLQLINFGQSSYPSSSFITPTSLLTCSTANGYGS